MENMIRIWNQIYSDFNPGHENQLTAFIQKLDDIKSRHFSQTQPVDPAWYKDVVVYSTYVDLFNRDFHGLKAKLPYLKALGITCLWLLPILKSPMKDAGFDISDYDHVRSDLLGLPADASLDQQEAVIRDLIEAAHAEGIRIIFDIAMNHCSEEHPWFQEARRSKDSPKRDYFIWRDQPDDYSQARIIFKGLCTSNWQWDEQAGQYFFHRFFEIQPDLNYRNPEVLLAMTQVLVDWKVRGIDGFRADAVPYIWKEEGTICENLPKTHLVVQFFRAALDYLSTGNLILAEACQPPADVVAYFGDNNECNAAYHFPVMPRIYRALAEGRKESIETVMSPDFTPAIPADCQWFMFLRCHDELTLEMVTPEERVFLYDAYAKDPLWDFRQGEGISARLADLLDRDFDRISLAYSIMFTLTGTPIVFYGDEFAKGNDVAFYDEMYRHSGYKDSRYLGRGRIDWETVDWILADPQELGYQIYHKLRQMIAIRAKQPAFARGSLTFLDLADSCGEKNPHVLAYVRSVDGQSRTVIQNLSDQPQTVDCSRLTLPPQDLLSQSVDCLNNVLTLRPFGYIWI